MVNATKIPNVTYVLIRCDFGETVIPQLTQKDHNPLEKWKIVEITPTK